MSDIEDNARSLTWWWEQLNLSEDWNSMTRGMRLDLVKKLQRVFIELADLSLSRDELLDLIKLTDPPTVWDAMLALRQLPNRKKKNHWEVLAYLNKIVINMWKQQHSLEKPSVQPPPEPRKEIKPVDWDTVHRWSPMNFGKLHCDSCGRLLRSDNTTGLCRTCQRKRNGKDIEH